MSHCGQSRQVKTECTRGPRGYRPTSQAMPAPDTPGGKPALLAESPARDGAAHERCAPGTGAVTTKGGNATRWTTGSPRVAPADVSHYDIGVAGGMHAVQSAAIVLACILAFIVLIVLI